MDTQTQIDRLIELAIVQRAELKALVEQLPQLREYLGTEIEKTFEQVEPQLRGELEEFCNKRTEEFVEALRGDVSEQVGEILKTLETAAAAKYSALMAERERNAELEKKAEEKIAEAAAALPSKVKEIVSAELARFPRAGEIDQLRKEFAEPRGLNPRGKWQAGETYNRLDLVTVNGDSFVSNIDGNKERPSRSATNWTLNAARGMGGGSGFTSLNNVLGDPSAGQIVGSEGGQYVRKTLVAGANITINETASSITIIGDEGQISLQDGTAAAPSLFFTNDTDTGLYRPTANTLGISVSGTQVAYFDANGITTVGAGATFDGSVHVANGNANNPSLSFTSDDNTGFFRHQPDEIGITLGGTQKATLTSTTFSITPNLSTSGNLTVSGASYLSGNSWFNLGSYSGTRALNFYYTGTNRQAFISSTGGGNFNGDIKFGVNGSGTDIDAVEVARINSVGLHIGPAGNASAPLQIENATTTSSRQAATGLRLSSPAGSGQTTPSIEFTNSVGTGAAIDSIRTAASYASSLRFFTSIAGGDVPTLALTLDSSQNATLAGNLTVSGGTLLFNQATAQYQTFNVNSGGTGDQVEIKYQQVGNGRAGIYFGTATGGSGYMRVQVGSSGATTALLANSTGNVLIGTTTDSSNGKLQLATHTTSAGGIGFGTSTSLYTDTARLVLVGGTTTRFRLLSTSGNAADFQFDNSELAIGNSSSIRFYTTGGTALTLDSSQRTQFAGNIGLGAAPLANTGIRNSLLLTASGGSAYGYQSGGTMTTAANNDAIFGMAIDNGYSNTGSYTNVTAGHLLLNARSFSGLAFGYGLRIGNITGATSNYAIRTGSGIVSFEDTTASTSTTTGALVVSGGVGVAGNVNAGGNLTVSGTGGISIGSATFTGGRALTATTGSGNSVSARLLQTGVADWEIKNVATTGRLAFQQSSTDYLQLTATGNFLLGTTSDAANARLNVLGANNAGIRVDQGSYNYHAAFEHIFSSLSYTTEYARIKSNGNLLLGTTTDSGNGKLQLATHTTSAGGIGFGTDVSLYRASAGELGLRSIGNEAKMTWNADGTIRAYAETSGTGFYLTSFTGAMYLRTNGYNTALTLDSSQRTFTASAAKIGSLTGTVDSRLHVYESTAVSDSNGLTLEQASTGDSLISFLLTGVQRWSVGIDNSDSDKFKIGTGSLGTADKFTVDTNGDATVAGTIAIGQYTTAGAPAYAKGKLYFDVTLNKLRVGGATGWETVTSA